MIDGAPVDFVALRETLRPAIDDLKRAIGDKEGYEALLVILAGAEELGLMGKLVGMVRDTIRGGPPFASIELERIDDHLLAIRAAAQKGELGAYIVAKVDDAHRRLEHLSAAVKRVEIPPLQDHWDRRSR